ncbi:SMP-30/gluconolactonase/LRE family protein [Pseudooceanicola sediminis]|uniref:SMP-30/gluconolactonase/LRE family protein n=1 Tax=Pseudooceanicola sediminis TaxID=2211117 RepID=A0A399IY92_9RHOB|nr:SMP-30/gluconolactonase/LRE family protein [Pseudooceanicola sediminis]KAA2316037.1 SMP-30/gluconolactonase/LRE family protein [Puniceibacterium sp. HSS470]RII38148.1 SMP-30/gluconolactonase/LRE family protein [Pseudooceanicola sediminis]
MKQPEITCVQQVAAQLGETPLWCTRTNSLWWIDIEQPRLWQLDPETGEARSWAQGGTYLGSLAFTRSGARLLARDLDLVTLDTDTGVETHFATTPEERHPATRLNDGRVDRHGRLWIGTMDNGLREGLGHLYRVDPDGRMTAFYDDVIVSNGIAFDPDGRHMYFTDTRRHVTWKVTLDAAGEVPVAREILADYSATGERPDGACVDADGCLWQAFFAGGKVVRYAPDGRIDREIALPTSNPTCLCFGGPDLRTLYVTTAFKFLSEAQLAEQPLAGSVFAIEGVGQGVPEHLFDI